MGTKPEDARPIICGRLVKTSTERIYVSAYEWNKAVSFGVGSWSTTYLRGCDYDGTNIIISEAGKYAFTCRIGISGGFNDALFYLDDPEASWWVVGVGGGWSAIKGPVRVRNAGTCFINWSAIGNMYSGQKLQPKLYLRSSGYICSWIYSFVDQERPPVLEWFRISENIGERSIAAWYWN